MNSIIKKKHATCEKTKITKEIMLNLNVNVLIGFLNRPRNVRYQ